MDRAPDMEWIALLPSYTVPNILPRRKPLCGHTRRTPFGWDTDCDMPALFIRTDEDGRAEYACAEHTV